MIMTNIILALAFIAMIGIAIWLFKDDKRRPDDPTAVRIRVDDDDRDDQGSRR